MEHQLTGDVELNPVATEEVVHTTEHDPVAEETKSMDETLAETMQAIKDRDSGKPADKDAKPASPDRDEGGRFKPRAEKPAAEAAPAEQEPAPVDAKPATDVAAPPKSWRPAAKAQWDALPPDVRSEVHKREEDFYKGIGQYKAKSDVADTLMGVLNPFQAVIAAQGTNIPNALHAMLQTASTLAMGTPAQKQQTLKSLAQQYGIDLTVSSDGQQGFADPQLTPLQQRIAALEGELAHTRNMTQNSVVQDALGKIQQFGSDPQNRYFEQVRPMMASLINGGLARDLPDAYQQACKLHPEVSAAIVAEQRLATDKKQREEAATRAAAAKRAVQVNGRNTPSAASAAAAATSMEETMRQRYRELNPG